MKNDAANLDENEIKHLEFIQGVITRMGANSFQMKGWAITIFSALLALFAGSSGDSRQLFLFAAAIETIIFWFLDAYYLQQERKFRGVYDDVAGLSINKSVVRLFEMPIQRYTGGKYFYWRVFFSHSVVWLYASMIVLAIVGTFLL
ncbi:MAG: hypothetical protein LBM75_07785 [Myxococcales bacterium]|jgi:hypothetical protein|nr:hypothetical protein [Myxococcales bacterium]